MTIKTDVAIIGGGPGGTTAAMYLAREGIKSLIIERDEFPRYHIGESMTGECGGILRDLGLEPAMLKARHPTKQGVRVFGPRGHDSWWVPVMRRNAAEELEPVATYQVRRSEFDVMMLDEARNRGADFLQAEATSVIGTAGDGIEGVRVRLPDGREEEVRAQVTLDVSGQRTFFARQNITSGKVPGRYDKQVAIFSQVANPVRDNGDTREFHRDNTLIFYKSKFHWAWLIPLTDDTVSVGVVAPGAYFASRKESKADYLRRELMELNPELARRVEGCELIEEARAIPNYSYHCSTFTGPGWMAIGDAHRFIDPIFSFGLFVSMREAQLAAPEIARYLGGERRGTGNPFRAHEATLERGLNAVQDLVDGFWENPTGFAWLAHGERRKADIIDLFAGRIYSETPSPGLLELRKMADKGRMQNPEPTPA